MKNFVWKWEKSFILGICPITLAELLRGLNCKINHLSFDRCQQNQRIIPITSLILHSFHIHIGIDTLYTYPVEKSNLTVKVKWMCWHLIFEEKCVDSKWIVTFHFFIFTKSSSFANNISTICDTYIGLKKSFLIIVCKSKFNKSYSLKYLEKPKYFEKKEKIATLAEIKVFSIGSMHRFSLFFFSSKFETSLWKNGYIFIFQSVVHR